MGRSKYSSYIFSWCVLLLVTMSFSCSSDNGQSEGAVTKAAQDPLVIYLVDEQMEFSLSYSEHMAKVFDYTKIPYEMQTVQEFNSYPYYESALRVIYVNNTEPLNAKAKDALLEFVAEGGTLVFPSVNEDQEAGFLSGIKPDAFYIYDSEATGITFKANILPGVKGKSIYPLKTNLSFKGDNFKEDVIVLATSTSDPSHPVILENKIGNGQVIHFNTSVLFEKPDRGLLYAAALKGLQGVPYPIVNASTIMIDDFPNPVYDVEPEPIKSELGITQAQYVMDVWWPDMLKVAEKFDIDYSVYPCFNYDRIKEPPFVFTEWDRHRSKRAQKEVISSNWLMDQVLENQFEMAFHGYNHESLIDSVWGGKEYMESALIAARKKWKVNRFGPFPKTYVPPSNDIDSIGLVALANAMPEMEFMCSIYEGELAEGGGREYDVDPFEPRLFDFPRVSSGYTFNDFKIYNQESLYLFTGVWSHFIHPDDVYQLPVASNTSAGDYGYRNAQKLNWYKAHDGKKGMYHQWNDYLQFVVETHPSTRFLDVYTGATIAKDWRQSDYEYEENGSVFNVKKSSKNQWRHRDYFWNMYVEKSNETKLIQELEMLEVSYSRTAFFGGFLYTIETPNPEFIFSKDPEFQGGSEYSLDEVYSQVNEQLDQYAIDRAAASSGDLYVETYEPEQPEVLEDSVAWLVENENLKGATDMLYERLDKLDQLDTAIFNDYTLYLAYQERANEVWSFFEEVYSEKSKQLALDYVNHYLIEEYYPNEELNRLWLGRMIENDMANTDLVRQYISQFYSTEYQAELRRVIQRQYEATGSAEAYAMFIRYLLDFEVDEVTVELKNKAPSSYPLLHPMATGITYAFSDSGMIQEALTWADYSSEIDIKTRLQWWVDLEAYNKMESVYLEFIKDNPLDYEVMAFVSKAWYDIGEYERGSLIAKRLPEADTSKVNFKKQFNTDARYFEPDVQKFLMVKTPSVYYPDTLSALQKEMRYNENNSIQYNTDYVVDNFKQSVWNNSVTYNLKTKKLNQHSLSVTYSDVSDLVLNNFDANNVSHSLYGLRYRYQTRENTEKPIFYTLGGLEQDDLSNTFFTIGAGISKSNQKNFKSLGYTFSPVKTGPAISREVYWGELVGYYESGYGKTFQTSFSPVLTHYTTGAVEGALTGRFFFNTKKGTGSRFSPYAEAFVSGANENQEDGNPYWIIDSRFYGGGGLAWTYGQDQSGKLYVRLEAGAFHDSYTDNFIRFTGNFAFPIKEFTYVTGQFEYFNQALYYSNGFQFGIKHFFRRRKEYGYKPREYEEWYEE
ncbi:DUF2194 domain-containing protein [Roseivirga sp.]|uniref:DUF2194 domain-containing protein n=2 Tax=Roseivirga sp. TaxID=1964215 RepID=UPI002356ED5F|nr:DUF2194 domain-containing protein [Roseivirga sp.]